MTALRTNDAYQKLIYDFMKDMYVICPSCGGQAIVRSPEFVIRPKDEREIKLICLVCGHNKRLDEKKASVLLKTSNNIITGRYFIIGAAIDPYFNLPLWLTTECCENVLWAYNYEHLDFLRKHVEAKLRERNIQSISNKSLGSRLPKWMSSNKNREAVLKCIDKLKNKKQAS